MALPAKTNPVSDQRAAERLALSRVYSQQNGGDAVDDAIKSLLPSLAKTQYAYKDGQLAVLFDEKFLSHSAAILINAVEQLPDIAQRVSFFDTTSQKFRPYDDVVWDIEKNPLDLARLAYRQASRSEHAPHIIVTPVVLGNSSRDRSMLDCQKLVMSGSPVKDLGMVVRLCARDAFGAASEWRDVENKRGNRQIVQADEINIGGIDEFQFPKPVMFMNISVSPACVRNHVSIPHVLSGMSYDRTI